MAESTNTVSFSKSIENGNIIPFTEYRLIKFAHMLSKKHDVPLCRMTAILKTFFDDGITSFEEIEETLEHDYAMMSIDGIF